MSEEIEELRDTVDTLKKVIAATDELMKSQREQLITMWAGSARRGRWLEGSEDGDGGECDSEAAGAEWEPYSEEEQACWLRDGIVPHLERLLFPHDDKGNPIIPQELLKAHGFYEEPEDETLYPRKNES